MTEEQKNNTENQNKKGTKDSIYKKWWFWVIAVFAFFIIIGAISEEPEKETEKEITEDVANKIEGEYIFIETEYEDERKPKFLGETKLPEGMELIFSIRKDDLDYSAQDSIEIKEDGGFETATFSDKGDSLASGTYQIEITSSLPELQPEKVREVIGMDGENLEEYVKAEDIEDGMIRYNRELDIQPEAEQIVQEETEEAKDKEEKIEPEEDEVQPKPEEEAGPTPEPEPEPEPEPDVTMGQKNALKSAKEYLDYSAFSREGLIEQLEYEGFTRQQAEYGVQAAGY